MTAAIVGIFLFTHFDADWVWYAVLIGVVALEAYNIDAWFKRLSERLRQIQISLHNLHHSRPEHHDED